MIILSDLERRLLNACAGGVEQLPYDDAQAAASKRLRDLGLIQSGYVEDQPTSWATDAGKAALAELEAKDKAGADKEDADAHWIGDPIGALKTIRNMCDAPYFDANRKHRIREIAHGAIRLAEIAAIPDDKIDTSDIPEATAEDFAKATKRTST